MSQEMYRFVGIRLLIVSVGACLVWNFVVKPQSDRVDSLDAALASQGRLIERYRAFKGESDAALEARTGEVLDAGRVLIMDAIVEGDAGTMLHSMLNEHASEDGVRISSIESVQTRELREKIGDTKREIVGDRAMLRVEFEGAYGDVGRFMDGMVRGRVPVKISGFRMIPIGLNAVRVSAEVEIVTLDEVPGVNSEFASVEMEMGS